MATILNLKDETPTGMVKQPSWLNRFVSMALVTHTNPVTGETWTAPNGGYTLNMPTSTAPAPMLSGKSKGGQGWWFGRYVRDY
jgi:hypothetical protein